MPILCLITVIHRNVHRVKFGRVLFRFLFTIPLLILALDGVQGSHSINESPWVEVLYIYVGWISPSLKFLVRCVQVTMHGASYSIRYQIFWFCWVESVVLSLRSWPFWWASPWIPYPPHSYWPDILPPITHPRAGLYDRPHTVNCSR